MSGSVFDLSLPNVAWPSPIAVDSNVVVANFQQFDLGQTQQQVERARSFFRLLLSRGQQAVLTPTAFSEVLHVVVRKTYEHRLRGNRAALSQEFGARIDGWGDLYKRDPEPIHQLSHKLTRFRESLVAYNLAIIDLDDRGGSAIPRSQHFGDELIERMVRYGLDSSDAMITLEASRLGINAIVSMDRDMQRAVADFDIYTWT